MIGELSDEDIAKLPEELKIKLIQYGWKKLEKKMTNIYANQSNPKLVRLWHDIMESIEE
jgi:hypothetical protein